MRVLQIIHGSEAGGVNTLAEIIGDGLAARGISVETVYLFPKRAARWLDKLVGTFRAAKRVFAGQYDALMAYQPSASILAGVMGWIAGCPYRIVHQTALPSELKPIVRWLDFAVGTIGLYTQNVANSRATLEAFAGYPATYRRDMILIAHGVPPPRQARARSATLAKFGIPPDGVVLLNVGRLTTQKNQRVLIQALSRLPRARLVIAGDGPLRSSYEALSVRFGVADRLHLLGEVARDEVSDLLGACDLFVFPSTWETFGLATVEAALAGLPIVAADLPVLREVLNGIPGSTFVSPFEPEAWIPAIASFAYATRRNAQWATEALARRYSVALMIDAYLGILGQPSALDMEVYSQ